MATSINHRWRKTTDVNREHALFELLINEASILDVGFADDGAFEIAFNPGIGGVVMEWDHLMKLVNEGKVLAEQDR